LDIQQELVQQMLSLDKTNAGEFFIYYAIRHCEAIGRRLAEGKAYRRGQNLRVTRPWTNAERDERQQRIHELQKSVKSLRIDLGTMIEEREWGSRDRIQGR
jgi:hypothetical protein